MSASTTYTPLRDDSTHRSLSNNERNFIHNCATGTHATSSSVLRTDGRYAGEARPIRLSFSRSHNMSECTVQLGANTRVSSCVTCSLIPPPHADRPNDGVITFAVDLSPMSAMGFEYSQPASTMGGSGGSSGGGGMGQAQSESQKQVTNRILRILERTLLNGGAIDAEALCVQSGKWVWRLHIDVTVLDHGGNLVDASVLSAVAAMRHFRKPEVQITEGEEDTSSGSGRGGGGDPNVLHSDEREPTPLPLHHTPLTMTFALFNDPTGATTTVSALLDPSQREELVMNGNVTFSFNKYGEICSLDFAGGCELKPRQLITCAKLGKTKCVELCNLLEKSLGEADEKSIEERLARLKVANGMGSFKDIPLPDLPENAPFVERTDYDRDADMMEIDQHDLSDVGSKYADRAAAIAAAEEESYRIQALDYSQGHIAAKVKENDLGKGPGNNQTAKKYGPIFGGSLMDAMLKSAGKVVNETTNIADSVSLNRTINVSIRTKEADDEMDQIVAQENSKNNQTAERRKEDTQSMAIDSDEEETITLHSEFASLPTTDTRIEKVTKNEETEKKEGIVESMMDDSDDDLDLSMAIKKKSKKKAKKSKK